MVFCAKLPWKVSRSYNINDVTKPKEPETKEPEEEEQHEGRRVGIELQPAVVDETPIEKHPKTPEEEAQIKKAIEENEFLNNVIKGKIITEIVASMYKKSVEQNEVLIKEGDKGDKMYISINGVFQVSTKDFKSTFEDMRVVGELAILHNARRLATITAKTSGQLWVLDGTVYKQIVTRDAIKEQDEIMQFLKNVKSFQNRDEVVLNTIASLLKTELFKTGTDIVKEGEKGDKFYIVRAGSVSVYKNGEGKVNTMVKGQYFGERALQKEEFRQATVKADAPCVECLTLTKSEFIKHIGDVADATESPRQTVLSPTVTSGYEDVNLNETKILRTLGVGGFGRVEYAQYKNKFFALKYYIKEYVVENHLQEHVHNEKNLQMKCNSIFIIGLYRTFKDRRYVFFLMEPCLGGDVFNLLKKQRNKRFEENTAKFISGCIIEAIHYLHRHKIIYRDLKPENMMIDQRGYIKLTDFGFAKTLLGGAKTYTFAGTPEYVAPEIVLNSGHDRAVDYWALGIFVFELLVGRTPFKTGDPSHMRTYNLIIKGIDDIQVPQIIPSKAKSLVKHLLRPIAMDRLGMQRGGMNDIKNQKWFQGFDWANLESGNMRSPCRPDLKNWQDNFDKFTKDRRNPQPETSGWDIDF